MQLAKLFLRQDDLEQAEKYAQEALLTSKIRQDPREIAHSYLVLGEINELQKDWKPALNYYYRALQLFENIKEKTGHDFSESRIAAIGEQVNAEEAGGGS